MENKSPGNNGLTKEFYCTFWNKIENIFIISLRESKCLKAFSTSQRQAVIRFIEKLNKDKRFISNWRPISLLNVERKLISKTLAARLKKVLPFLIGLGQTVYVNGRFLGESGRLIADIIETCDLTQLEGYLLAIDFEKAFDSLNHNFLITTLEHYGFGNDFIEWIKILLKNRESCVINGGHTTKYFRVESGAGQGDPISAYLIILALEILFIFIKFNKNIDGINIFNHAYDDDATFFLKNQTSVKNSLNDIKSFSNFSGLRLNLDKCEIAGIGILKNVNVALCGVALCGMKNINLTKESIKFLQYIFLITRNFKMT